MVAIEWNPTRRQLRKYGISTAIICCFVGAWVWWVRAFAGLDLSPPAAAGVAVGLWGLGGIHLLLGLAAPRILRLPYIGLTVITLPIAFVISTVVLLVLYLLVLTPIGVVMRLLRGDPLHRRFDPYAESYWADHPQPGGPESYFRQF